MLLVGGGARCEHNRYYRKRNQHNVDDQPVVSGGSVLTGLKAATLTLSRARLWEELSGDRWSLMYKTIPRPPAPLRPWCAMTGISCRCLAGTRTITSYCPADFLTLAALDITAFLAMRARAIRSTSSALAGGAPVGLGCWAAGVCGLSQFCLAVFLATHVLEKSRSYSCLQFNGCS